jgi:hypothetical protein
MHGIGRSLLFTVGTGIVGAGILLGQHYGGGGRAPLPSSTAIGAGALTSFPSSTARSTSSAYGRSTYYGNRTYSHAGAYSRQYRPLPRSYVVAPYYYPFFDWSGGGTDYSAAPYGDYGPGPDYGYGPDPNADPMMMSQAALGQQVQRLTAQVNDLMYGQGPPPQQAVAPEQPPPVPLTLILRSGERVQVENYAVANNMFWDFTQRGTRKIPLSNIDLAASAKATQANGGEFPQLDGAQ